MSRVVGVMRRRVESEHERAVRVLRGARRRSPWFDHLSRAYERYQEHRGDRMAAAITYFGFLSFFPLLALAYALLGYVVGISEQARGYLVDAINSVLPGIADRLAVEQIAQAKATAGVIGLVGLLIIGVAWVEALRESLREIWGHDPTGGGNFLKRKLGDVGVLVFLGMVLIVSVAVSTITTSGTNWALHVLGLDRMFGMGVLLRLLAVAVAICFNALIFLVLFSRLTGTRAPWRRIIRGALFGAVGLEILKLLATFLVGHTTRNPVYASFAVVAGLLVWMNVVSRFTLFTAAWTATRRVVLSADRAPPPKAEDTGR
ncbi:YihY/virulence factor BrkB family protein [Actinomadura sp. HBU206391]|uniref:YihY/virulence factor BrkB family protein n=1 Tax=Actinomadura sp. HBU206391 TaxID=2731692 RepID=UPI00164F7ED8|nr:YihY/virulence factor BrkB family protein [Actinomadura sp. HBU206391]MBC6456872.1 YihY/virulence factor BrkB family protein [Actinomadura sp. HBU206391]